MSASRCRFATACLLSVFLLPVFAAGDDSPPIDAKVLHNWPQFLGSQRNGIANETGLVDSFPAQGPKVLWRVKGGVGMSGVAVVGGRAVTLIQTQGRQRVLALDAGSGKTLWSTPVAAVYRNQMGDGPRATPTIHNDTVFVFTGEGTLAALKLSDGSLIWSKRPLKEFGGKPADYGMACSPLIVGDLVVVTAGTKAGTVIAYRQRDGKPVWKSGSDVAGYSSPALLNVGGQRQVVVFTGESALGLEPKTGTILWRYPFTTDYDCNIATPLAIDGRVFISSGENHGSALLALQPAGESFTVKAVWTSFGPRSVLRNEWQTSILHKGFLYGLDNVGSAGPVTHLHCVHAATGRLAWQQKRFGKSNGIFADGKLWYVTMKGELVIVKPDPTRFIELARSKPLLGKTRQAPSLAHGRLYLRDDREILCCDVRRQGAGK